jgi:hypothetical protein
MISAQGTTQKPVEAAPMPDPRKEIRALRTALSTSRGGGGCSVPKDPIMGDVWHEYGEHAERFRELNSKLQEKLEEARRIDGSEQRILERFDTAFGEQDKAALLFEAKELQKRRQQVDEEWGRLLEEFEELEAAHEALTKRADERLEDVRKSALETEKMLFDIGKLVATLSIGTIVAMSAVTPALLPKLDNLEGLWPAFGWLLTSVAVSIIMCIYSTSQVSQLLARGSMRRRRSIRSKLPSWASNLVRVMPYSVLLTFSVGALLIGIVRFVLFISVSIG